MVTINHKKNISSEEAIFAFIDVVKDVSRGIIEHHENNEKEWYTLSTTVFNLKTVTPSYLSQSIFGQPDDNIVIKVENVPVGLKEYSKEKSNLDYKQKLSIEFMKK